jgi:hypothetical protein
MHIVYVAIQLQAKDHLHTRFVVQSLQVIEDVPPSDRNKEQQYCPLIFIFYPNFIGRWITFHVYLYSNPVCKWKTLFKVEKMLRIFSIACSYMIDLFHFRKHKKTNGDDYLCHIFFLTVITQYYLTCNTHSYVMFSN